MALERCRHDGPFVNAGSDQPVGLPALNVEIQLVAFDLGQARGDGDGATGSCGRKVADVNLVAHGRMALRENGLQRSMTGHLHEADDHLDRRGLAGTIWSQVSGDFASARAEEDAV